MSDGVARFCTSCGTPLAPGEAFCTSCGARSDSAAPATPPSVAPSAPAAAVPAPMPPGPAPAAGAERVLAVIGNLTRQSGFMGMKQSTYSLVITDHRLIFAELTREKITAMVSQARDSAKAEGKGFFGQWGAQIGTSFNYHEVYWQMPPDAALAETPGNFAIPRSEFQKAKFKLGVTDESHNTPDRLIIKAASGKYEFAVNGSLGAVKDAFRQTGLA
jgi:hypothetical protein